jgi:glycosyltransferase involved in cell wall biosynthesis
MTEPDIAIHLPTLDAGGAERVMLTAANGLAERGYAVDLVLSQRSGGFSSDISESLRVVDLDAPAPPVLAAVGALPAMYRYLERTSPGVLISSMKHINVLSLAVWRLSQVDTNIVLTEHNTPEELIRGSPKNRLIYRIAAIEYPWADEIIGVSEGVVDSLSDIVDIPRQQIEMIHNPVVSSSLVEQSHQNPDHPWFDDDNTRVVLSVGRLTEQKNQELLLNAFSDVCGDENVKLVLVGQGERAAALETLAGELGVADHVEIREWVDNIYAYMGSADVFVLTSKWEGLPTVLIEALACGCPVVSTDCPSGPREILDGGEYGTLVETYDSSDVAEAIRDQLHDPTPESTCRDRGADFSVERCIDRYEELLGPYLSQTPAVAE